MHYVILRDDDTNALTSPDLLETLYRPFLKWKMPVTLATIPCVSREARMGDGKREGFLPNSKAEQRGNAPISEATELLAYLKANPCYQIAQHGLFHEFEEFNLRSADEAARRLEAGANYLNDAGLSKPAAFVAPHDKFSPASFRETARRFPVISSGWFELRRLPYAWWPKYMLRKLRGNPHWSAGGTLLLSHPGCILSYHRHPGEILPAIQRQVLSRSLTVLVTHWWEYFYEGERNAPFIQALHDTCEWLGSREDVRVISFEEAARMYVPARFKPRPQTKPPRNAPAAPPRPVGLQAPSAN